MPALRGFAMIKLLRGRGAYSQETKRNGADELRDSDWAGHLENRCPAVRYDVTRFLEGGRDTLSMKHDVEASSLWTGQM